jgi:hypothetical protein
LVSPYAAVVGDERRTEIVVLLPIIAGGVTLLSAA